eukprot:TRINITY_DN9269_c0_g1_i1.p3 TRINITY_DN9269_c0_g1~~TRINITY_DN9269_c0_g1_i1.p3  ORF type:complete len:50 (+),score=7.24 TRINITY_DN9269_c0_g1_i1:157-306(+)
MIPKRLTPTSIPHAAFETGRSASSRVRKKNTICVRCGEAVFPPVYNIFS